MRPRQPPALVLTNATGLPLSTGVSGTLPASAEPVHTGDVTNTAGSLAMTVKGINGTILSGLATGLLKNTTGTGVPTIAAAGTDYLTPTGNGSGLTSITAANISAGTAPISITGSAATATTATSFSGSLAGDVTGTQGATKVTAIQGVAVSATAPTSGQFLRYNGTQWAATAAPFVPVTATSTAVCTSITSTTYVSTFTAGTGCTTALSVAVTSTTTTSALVIVTAQLTPGSSDTNWASFGISGATTLAASDLDAVVRSAGSSSSTGGVQASTTTAVTLTPGTNTFTMQYKDSASGTYSITNRTITVIPLN